ncbi:hypothetical protein AB0B94_31160 [Micromonospora sp. NPDC048986]|uniref:hypothetical protein n=1 Tax=Micromonospora sp. NPDC048986 TaxID=3155644 RepID=UPI0033C83022
MADAVDLRHLALIFDQGRKGAEQVGDAGLAQALWFMTEAAVGYHQNFDGGVWNLEEDFAQLVKRIGL